MGKFLPEYESWKESLGGNASGWSIKYYKGLGTSRSKEGKEYFSNLQMHKKDFMWVDEQDGEAIELAFSKKKIEWPDSEWPYSQPTHHLFLSLSLTSSSVNGLTVTKTHNVIYFLPYLFFLIPHVHY
ncbi:hypothetical protein ACSBR2_018112 [Camellia fascicularis]